VKIPGDKKATFLPMKTFSYLAPQVEVLANPAKGGQGIYAQNPIHPGELILVWGGKIHTYEQYLQAPEARRPHFVQVEEDLYLGTPEVPEPADYVNHSCNPNAGFSGQIALVALREILPGEEICIDYAMCDGSPYDEFDCACGAPNCRGRVTGNDWQRPDLQQKYAGFFSPYLQRRIDQSQSKP
jgi:uncharacterized protein